MAIINLPLVLILKKAISSIITEITVIAESLTSFTVPKNDALLLNVSII